MGTAVITGGAGFIGTAIANALVDEYEVIVVDNLSLGTTAQLSDEVTFVEEDVRTYDLPDDVDTLYHLGGRSSLSWCEEDPAASADENVTAFARLLDQTKELGANVVWASTSSIYGTRTTPTDENDALDIVTAYDASKHAAESYATYFRRYHDQTIATMRPYSVYGGPQYEAHKGDYKNIITTFAEAIAEGDRPVLFEDGEQTRDFVHVDDVVRAFRAAGEQEVSGTYNIATGNSTSFNAIVSELGRRLGRPDIEPTYKEAPYPDEAYVKGQCGSYKRLSEATGWYPRVSLDEGLDRVCAQLDGVEE